MHQCICTDETILTDLSYQKSHCWISQVEICHFPRAKRGAFDCSYQLQIQLIELETMHAFHCVHCGSLMCVFWATKFETLKVMATYHFLWPRLENGLLNETPSICKIMQWKRSIEEDNMVYKHGESLEDRSTMNDKICSIDRCRITLIEVYELPNANKIQGNGYMKNPQICAMSS